MRKCTGQDPNFDGDGPPVATVPFQYPGDVVESCDERQLRLETATRLISLLIENATSAKRISARVLLMAFFLRCPGAPKRQRDLAGILGISEAAVANKVKRLREQLREMAG